MCKINKLNVIYKTILSLLTKMSIPSKTAEAIAYSCQLIAKTKEIRLLKIAREFKEIMKYYKRIQRIKDEKREEYADKIEQIMVNNLVILKRQDLREVYVVIDPTSFARKKSEKTEWIGKVYDDEGGVVKGVRIANIVVVIRRRDKKWIKFSCGYVDITNKQLDRRGKSQNQVLMEKIEEVYTKLLMNVWEGEVILIGDTDIGNSKIIKYLEKIGVKYILEKKVKEGKKIVNNIGIGEEEARKIYRKIKNKVEEMNSIYKSKGIDFRRERFLKYSYFKLYLAMVMLIWYVIMLLVYYGVGSISRGDSRWKCLSEEIRIYERIRGVGWVDKLWIEKIIETTNQIMRDIREVM